MCRNETLVLPLETKANKRERGASACRDRGRPRRADCVADDAVACKIAVDDPTTWSSPRRLVIPWNRSEDALSSHACHEGNYGMAVVLAVARADARMAGKPQ